MWFGRLWKVMLRGGIDGPRRSRRPERSQIQDVEEGSECKGLQWIEESCHGDHGSS